MNIFENLDSDAILAICITTLVAMTLIIVVSNVSSCAKENHKLEFQYKLKCLESGGTYSYIRNTPGICISPDKEK